MEGLVIVNCLRISYKAGKYELVQGVSGICSGQVVNGRYYRSRGTGWGERIKTSKLILHATIQGQPHEIWIDRFFKRTVGRLTSKRRDIIARGMPQEIEVEQKEGRRGTTYYHVTEAELRAWLDRISAQL